VEYLRIWLAMGGFAPEGLTSGPDVWECIQNDARNLETRLD
jgi:hypothetical protein